MFEKSRTILSELKMTCTFEGHQNLYLDAIMCVLHVYNRTLTRSNRCDIRHITPFEIVPRDKPDLSNLKIFSAKVKLLKPKSYRKSKVEPYVRDSIHAGYHLGDAYRLCIPKLGRVFVSKDASFIEKSYPNPDYVTFQN